MKFSELRAEARAKLSGKWGKVALITLAYFSISIIISIIENYAPEGMASIISIASTIIQIPLSFGLVIALFKLYNSEDVKAYDFFSLGFNNFKKAWGIYFNMLLKMIVPIIITVVTVFLLVGSSIFLTISASYGETSAISVILMIVSIIAFFAAMIWSILISYYYSLSFIVAADKPELTSKEAVNESKTLMKGNRAKLFGLQLSFIGWCFLAVLSFGIGYLWIMPYIQFATFTFYKYLVNKNENN